MTALSRGTIVTRECSDVTALRYTLFVIRTRSICWARVRISSGHIQEVQNSSHGFQGSRLVYRGIQEYLRQDDQEKCVYVRVVSRLVTAERQQTIEEATGKNSAIVDVGGRGTVAVFSPDGKTLASGDSDNNTIMLWDVATDQNTATLSNSNGYVNSVAYHLWQLPWHHGLHSVGYNR